MKNTIKGLLCVLAVLAMYFLLVVDMMRAVIA